jgi:DNA-binding transcriptional ArsR family regulator
LELKKLLASSLRQKILKELSECKEINVMGLVRRINSTYNEVSRNLKILEEEGMVMNNYFGRVRMIRLNREDARTIVLLRILKTLENSSASPG